MDSDKSCATCKHWLADQGEKSDWRVQIRLTLLPGEDEDQRYDLGSPHEQRVAKAERLFGRCSLIRLLDSYDEIAEEDLPLAFCKDGSDYRADLFTRAEFGCAAHEPADAKGNYRPNDPET